MNKKASAKVKRASAKLKKTKALHKNKTSRPQMAIKTPEEHYDYAISLMNAADYEGARAHLEKLQKQVPKADYVWYGMAVLDCLTHHYETALKTLEQAIKLNPSNRYHARNESDFQNM